MSKETTNQEGPGPELSKAELGDIHRLAVQGGNDTEDDTTDDWDPAAEKPAQEEEKKKGKPGRPKKEKPAPAPRQTKPIEIRAGALNKEIFCNFIYDHNLAPTITNEIKVKSEIPVHDDLRNAFKQLVPHLAIIFGRMTMEEVAGISPGNQEDPALMKLFLFDVTEFFLDGYGDEESVVLVGTEKLPTGEAKLTTPDIRFFGSKYGHATDLRLRIDEVITEIEEYLHGRKRADDPQLSLGL